MRKGIILFIFFTLIWVAGCSSSPNLSPKYNSNESITYNKPYFDLKDELLYARIITGDDSTGRKTVSLIKDKERLVQIVQEFDKLKSYISKEKCHIDHKKRTYYVVRIWREGTSVSYVIMEYQSNFYYQDRINLEIKRVPEKLVKLLGF